jgi:hypothetical protein
MSKNVTPADKYNGFIVRNKKSTKTGRLYKADIKSGMIKVHWDDGVILIENAKVIFPVKLF